jgi:hypothetical protein
MFMTSMAAPVATTSVGEKICFSLDDVQKAKALIIEPPFDPLRDLQKISSVEKMSCPKTPHPQLSYEGKNFVLDTSKLTDELIKNNNLIFTFVYNAGIPDFNYQESRNWAKFSLKPLLELGVGVLYARTDVIDIEIEAAASKTPLALSIEGGLAPNYRIIHRLALEAFENYGEIHKRCKAGISIPHNYKGNILADQASALKAWESSKFIAPDDFKKELEGYKDYEAAKQTYTRTSEELMDAYRKLRSFFYPRA